MNRCFELIEKGYRIIPVIPRGKRPLVDGWPEKATTNREQAEQWARDYKGCNWGIVCSNVIVFDLDRKDRDGKPLTDAELMEHWNYFRETYHLPEAPEVVTGSGGRHYYFKRPYAEILAQTGFAYSRNGETVRSNIDIRVGNSYVVAPGSVNADGNEYKCPSLWAGNELNELPADFVEILPKKNRTAAPKSAPPAPLAGDYADCEKYIDKKETLTEGDGGKKLYDVCNCIFWEFGFDRNDPQARAILNSYLSRVRRNDGSYYPWTDGEIEHKIDDVFKYPPNKPFGFRRRANQMNAAQNFLLDFTVNGKRINEQTDAKPVQTEEVELDKSKFIIQPMSDFKDEIFDSFTSETKVIKTGFTQLDKFLCGGISGLTLVGGKPGLGKSSFALQIADHAAYTDKKVLIVSLEMSRNQLAAKSVSRLSGGLVYGFPDGALFDYLTQDVAEKRANKLKEKFLNVKQIMRQKYMPFTDEQAELYRKARRLYEDCIMPNLMVIQRGKGDRRHVSSDDVERSLDYYERITGEYPDLLITDYLQLFDEESRHGRELTDKQQADQAVGNLKAISEDIPVIAISSFNRPAYVKPVSRESFKESGGIEYTAELMFGLQAALDWENTEEKDVPMCLNQWDRQGKANRYREIQLVLLKDRYGEDGEIFKIGMIPSCGMFYESDLGREERAYKAELNSRRGPSLAVIGNQIADVLADKDGLKMPLGDGTPDTDSATGRTVFGKTLLSDLRICGKPGYTKERIIDAIKADKSLDSFRDEAGVAWVALKPRKPKLTSEHSTLEVCPGCPTETVPREPDEQDKFDSID